MLDVSIPSCLGICASCCSRTKMCLYQAQNVGNNNQSAPFFSPYGTEKMGHASRSFWAWDSNRFIWESNGPSLLSIVYLIAADYRAGVVRGMKFPLLVMPLHYILEIIALITGSLSSLRSTTSKGSQSKDRVFFPHQEERQSRNIYFHLEMMYVMSSIQFCEQGTIISQQQLVWKCLPYSSSGESIFLHLYITISSRSSGWHHFIITAVFLQGIWG